MEGFRGISLAQDSRFKSADKKLLAKMKFAPELDQKVDLNKVEIVAFRVWVAQRITSILGFEDEVVVELVFGHLETPAQQGGHESNINPKDMQIQLTGFLGAEQGMLFMKDLWTLLLSAQSNCKFSKSEGSKPVITQRGIPSQFIEEKQKAYEQEKRRISALAEKKMAAPGGFRDAHDDQPRKADPHSSVRDGGRDSSRAHDGADVKRQHDRDMHRDAGRASGSRGISNTPAWMVAEGEASKAGDGNKLRSRDDHGDDRAESRKGDDSDRQRRRDSGNRGSNAEDDVRDRGSRHSTRDRHRDDDRDRSRERERGTDRDSRRDSGRRDRSRDRERDRRRSRSGSRDRRRRDTGSDAHSSRHDDRRVRRSRRSRSPVISSSSSGGSLSPASK